MLDTKLLTFLEGKPPGETYNYDNSSSCAAAQFNRSVGREYCAVRTEQNFDGRLEKIAHAQPWTFGALLERARKEFEPV